MRTVGKIGFIVVAVLFICAGFLDNSSAESRHSPDEKAGVQYDPEDRLDPADEELDEVSHPIDEISEPLETTPTETLGEDSEPIDELGENLDEVSEPVGEDSEDLPIAPEGDGSDLEYDTEEAEMPLGDREAEGEEIGDY